MRLIFLPANQAWVFVMGTELVRMGDYEMFFEDRVTATRAARNQGLRVTNKGNVHAFEDVHA